MRSLVAVVLAAAVVVSGCSAGTADDAVPGTESPAPSPSSTGIPSLAAPSAAPASGSPGSSPPAGPSGWTLVSGNLTRPGAQVAFDAARDGQTVVASVLTEDTPLDYDAGVIWSTDGGANWAWGEVLADAGRTYPKGIALVPAGAVVVGSTEVGEGAELDSSAFVARAAAPDYALEPLTLPRQFDGTGVHLEDIAVVGDEWVIAGYTVDPGANGGQPRGALWRSGDDGATWTRQEITLEGATGVALKQLAIAPDGSWNLVGQSTAGDRISQYDALWLQSTDAGQSFAQVRPAAFEADFDQGVTSISFSAQGSAALVGWDEVTDEHGVNLSALWISVPGHGVKRIGGPRIAVKDGTPPGEFLDGVVWQGEDPVAWGSTTGEYPMDEVQFWALSGAELVPTSVLPGGGAPLAVDTILAGSDDDALAFGLVGDLDQADVAVWQGSLGG